MHICRYVYSTYVSPSRQMLFVQALEPYIEREVVKLDFVFSYNLLILWSHRFQFPLKEVRVWTWDQLFISTHPEPTN